MGVVDGHGHEGFCLVTGIAKHDALVTGTASGDIFFSISEIRAALLVNTLSDIGGLIGERGNYTAGCAVKAFFAAVITDAVDHFAHESVDIDISFGRNLTIGENEAGLDGGFAGHTAGLIAADHFVQNGVADLIAHFVGVTFGHGF